MTIGDLAQTYLMRHSSARLTRTLSTLGEELTTGLKKDVPAAMSGDTGPIAALDRALVRLESLELVTKEAGIQADVVVGALSAFGDRIGSIDIGALSQGATGTQISSIARGAKQAFLGAISDLGVSVAGRPLFGGTAASGSVLRGGEEIFADMVASVSIASNAQELKDGIDAYFADNGLFQTNDYLGQPTNAAPIRLGDGSVVNMDTRADDPAIRAGLAAMARVAVLGEPLALSQTQISDVARGSLDPLLSARGAAIELSARHGVAQGTIEAAKVRVGVERDSLRTGRLNLLAADPYETATRLQQAELQIETLHILTARLSRLNLTNFV